MGRNNKKYKQSLHTQAYNRLTAMQAFGESKRQGKADGSASGKIYSYSTYQTYKRHIQYFLNYMKENHPEITSLNKSRRYVNEWLTSRAEQTDEEGNSLSSWTIALEASALAKLFGITPDDPDRFVPPKRRRTEIRRSRTGVEMDRHFSLTQNAELIKFCRGTGLRREGVESVRGRDLFTREQIITEIERLERIIPENRSEDDTRWLFACKDALLFDKHSFFCRVKEKGGKIRLAPICGNDVNAIVTRFKNTRPDDKVWLHVSSHADIHSYRADYARRVYQEYARPLESIPYDKVHKGTGHKYQSDVYCCRGDLAGLRLDRLAMLRCSKALGHNRIEICATNYLR